MRRPLCAASLALLVGVGCHAGPQAKVAKTDPVVTRTDPSAARFIARHNKNAASIHSLEAAPGITMIGDNGERRFSSRVSGHLALEGSKNFSLDLEVMRRNLANIGSNDQGFWFWVDDDKDKSIYVCDHKDVDACQLAMTLQPDWIMEAMGLRSFTPDEVKKLSVKAGEIAGTIVLTQIRKDPKGQVFTKETIVNEQANTIREHKLYSGYKQDLIASAVVKNYSQTTIFDSQVSRTGGDEIETENATTETVVQLPEQFRLTWVKEGLTLDVSMPKPKINPTFGDRRRALLFTEPKISGTTRRDLARLDPATSPASSRVYESKPIPDSGVRLGYPEPSAAGSAGESRRSIDPVPASTDLSTLPGEPVGVVGAPIPTATDGGIGRPSFARRWRSPSLER